MRNRLSLLGSFAFALGISAACSTPEPGGFSAPEVAAAECKRGDREACTCATGKASTKTCSSAGKFLECACDTKAVCGDGTCDAEETCKDCPSDCGACPVCAEARSCTTGASAPGQTKAVPGLDVRLEAMPKERVLADLVAAAERGEPGLTLLESARPARRPPGCARRSRRSRRSHPRFADSSRDRSSPRRSRAPLRSARRRHPRRGRATPARCPKAASVTAARRSPAIPRGSASASRR